ncbi:MFS transporter [Carnimonas bestiolae]|uniref:MFS transporter n=1 Tax=Carnimonas bestiolae TaxID=3402172 RepID=UPI003EDC438A
MPIALWVLVIGSFGVGMAEFVIAGILPHIASTFNASIPAAGYMVTLYALGVFISAPLMAMLGTRFRHKYVLVGCMGIFIVGNLITALAPTLGIALLGRIITSLNQGAFFGIGFLVAMSLVAKEKRASAIAYVFSGLTVANLAGIPVASWLSPIVGWQHLFYGMALIGLVSALGIAIFVPSRPVEATSIRTEVKAFFDPQVVMAMGVTVLGPSAFIDAITYISPIATEVAHFSAGSVPWIMVIFGLGLVIGNLLGGRFADRSLYGTLFTSLAMQVVALVVLWLGAESRIIVAVAIFFVAAFGFAGTPPIQKLVMDRAHAAGASVLASSVNIGMFNLGNALGAWFGGVTISAGFGYQSAGWSGALLALAALVMTAATYATRHANKAHSGE